MNFNGCPVFAVCGHSMCSDHGRFGVEKDRQGMGLLWFPRAIQATRSVLTVGLASPAIAVQWIHEELHLHGACRWVFFKIGLGHLLEGARRLGSPPDCTSR